METTASTMDTMVDANDTLVMAVSHTGSSARHMISAMSIMKNIAQIYAMCQAARKPLSGRDDESIFDFGLYYDGNTAAIKAIR